MATGRQIVEDLVAYNAACGLFGLALRERLKIAHTALCQLEIGHYFFANTPCLSNFQSALVFIF
jgi:hypothetical protein